MGEGEANFIIIRSAIPARQFSASILQVKGWHFVFLLAILSSNNQFLHLFVKHRDPSQYWQLNHPRTTPVQLLFIHHAGYIQMSLSSKMKCMFI